MVDNWWQTEIAGPVIGTLPTFEARPGKAGKPMPGAQLAVVNRDGSAVPDGQGGLLVIKFPLPYMLRTVWNDPNRYEDYWRDIPGCYSAGDVAVRDADGYIAVLVQHPGSDQAVRLLMARGADVNARAKGGGTADFAQGSGPASSVEAVQTAVDWAASQIAG